MSNKNNPLLKETKQKTEPPKPKNVAKVALDSGAVAKLPFFEQPSERRGPFDIGLLGTWILYIIFILLSLLSLIGLIILAVGCTNTIFGVASDKNQQIKVFGLCLTSTVFTSSFLLLACFGFQHAKEVGWIPSFESSSEKKSEVAQNAKINALYSVDPNAPDSSRVLANTPISPTQLIPRVNSQQPLIY